MSAIRSLLHWWKTQNTLIKLVSVVVVLFMACCLCSIPVALVNPSKKPTPKPVAQDPSPTAVSDAPASTPVPVSPDTPTPTSTPQPPTSTPSPLAFADVIQKADEKGWNATQYSAYLDTIKGRQITGWTGAILEIDESGGRPYLSLDARPGEPKIDIYAYISKADLVKVGMGQTVTIAGEIGDPWPESNGFYAMQLEKVTLEKLGDIPPTPTPTLTPIPTPDIGNDIEAEVMCKDFVRDNLKSPTSADFGGMFDDRDKAMFLEADKAAAFGVDTTKLRNTGVWVVAGQVDAQNSFGAMIRSEYTCVMDYDKESKNWYLLDISIK